MPECKSGLESWQQGRSGGPPGNTSCDSMAYSYKHGYGSDTPGKRVTQFTPTEEEEVTKRTETPEESLTESLLYEDIDNENITKKDLDELFCRDIEAFSQAFEVRRVKFKL